MIPKQQADDLSAIYQVIAEKKISKADVKIIASKDTDDKDLEKLITNDVEKYVREFFSKMPNVKGLVLKYLSLSGITKADPELQLFAIGLKKMHDALKAAGKLDDIKTEQ
jgi:hypothetical protein